MTYHLLYNQNKYVLAKRLWPYAPTSVPYEPHKIYNITEQKMLELSESGARFYEPVVGQHCELIYRKDGWYTGADLPETIKFYLRDPYNDRIKSAFESIIARAVAKMMLLRLNLISDIVNIIAIYELSSVVLQK